MFDFKSILKDLDGLPSYIIFFVILVAVAYICKNYIELVFSKFSLDMKETFLKSISEFKSEFKSDLKELTGNLFDEKVKTEIMQDKINTIEKRVSNIENKINNKK